MLDLFLTRIYRIDARWGIMKLALIKLEILQIMKSILLKIMKIKKSPFFGDFFQDCFFYKNIYNP